MTNTNFDELRSRATDLFSAGIPRNRRGSRRFTPAHRSVLAALSFDPAASVRKTAEGYGVRENQLYYWRSQLRKGSLEKPYGFDFPDEGELAFAELKVVDGQRVSPQTSTARMCLEVGEVRLHIEAAMPPDQVGAYACGLRNALVRGVN